jgi:hypothetical protein
MSRRAENFATLAANATQRVVRIFHGHMAFSLRAPIDLEVRDEGPYCLVEYEPLGIQGRGRDQEEALESFADQFRGMWEWIASADDPKLTQDARRLKRKMLSLVKWVRGSSSGAFAPILMANGVKV